MIKKEDLKMCSKCDRGNFEDLKIEQEVGEWPKESQRYEYFLGDGKYNGCSSCGGFGFTRVKAYCGGCAEEYWTWPQAITMYHGKPYDTADGKDYYYTSDKGSVCKQCWKELYE